MGKSMLYSLFGFGKLPKAELPTMQKEGIVMMDEGIKGSVTLRKFRSPGRYHSYKKSAFSGSIVITKLRFAVFSFSRPIVNLPINGEKMSQLELALEKEETFVIKFDAGAFNEKWKGSVECRLQTPQAALFLEQLNSTAGSEAGR